MKKLASALVIVGMLGGSTALADEFTESVDQTLRFREAGFYGQTADQRGIAIGIESVDLTEQARLLGRAPEGYLVYNVAITNNSPVRLYLDNYEIRDTATEKPMAHDDLNRVLYAVNKYYRGNKGHFRMSMVRENLIRKSFRNSVIEPGQTIQGLVFVRALELGEAGGTLHIRVQSLKRIAFLEIEVPFAR